MINERDLKRAFYLVNEAEALIEPDKELRLLAAELQLQIKLRILRQKDTLTWRADNDSTAL